nr:prolipoprotein diacylglyceryl transferase [Candidatus Riesia pediculischaeffi]
MMKEYHYVKHDIDPIAISFGNVIIHWYGLIYFLNFFVFRWLFFKKVDKKIFKKSEIENLLYLIFLGSLLGGRLGYVFLYNFSYFLKNLHCIFYIWNGGMSFHGGLIGVILMIWVYSVFYKRSFLKTTDLIAPLVPIVIGFGRLGNFINGELWGKVTFVPWAIIFPKSINDDIIYITENPIFKPIFKKYLALPRHPSQLYEMLLEGVFLFFILRSFEKSILPTGVLSANFLFFYGIFRILIEIFRQPDYQVGLLYGLSLGQILSLPMVFFGLSIYIGRIKDKKN